MFVSELYLLLFSFFIIIIIIIIYFILFYFIFSQVLEPTSIESFVCFYTVREPRIRAVLFTWSLVLKITPDLKGFEQNCDQANNLSTKLCEAVSTESLLLIIKLSEGKK